MNKNNLYKIYYNENEYITEFLDKKDIENDCLTEKKAFDIFFDDMILCNDYIKHNYDNCELLTLYDDYIDEYQFFIVTLKHNENITIDAVKNMGNTLYYDDVLNIYIMGVTDFGTSRDYVYTDICVEHYYNDKDNEDDYQRE